jgi:phosphomannomutase/phosphoglucomutase
MEFGTDGIRGILNKNFTLEEILNLGKAIGSYLEEVVVGEDTRPQNKIIKFALISGILSTGTKIIDVGVSPTPAIQYFVKNFYKGGVVITASHNPPEYTGIKFIQESGSEFFRDMEISLKKILNTKNFKIGVGNYIISECNNFYIENLLKHAKISKTYKVVVDCGGGATCYTTPKLLKELGCEVITINSNPGIFSRNPEPSPENLKLLMKVVKETDADLGIAHDGDGDRTIFIDENGNFVPGEISFAIIAKYILEKKKGKVITPVSTSKCVEDVVKETGGRIIYTKVGAPVIEEVILKENAILGGEENGGIIYPDWLNARDGGMTIVKMLEILEDRKLSELINEIPKYYTIKHKIPYKEGIIEKLKEKYPESDFTDGIKIFFEDGWVLVRKSGTEPIYRIFSEAKTKEKAEKYLKEILDIIHRQ